MNSPIRTECTTLIVPFGEYWTAYRDVWGPDMPIGHGSTKQAAIDSLLDQEADDARQNEEDYND